MKISKNNELEQIIIYRSNYGLPLNKGDRFINWLWYNVAKKNSVWAKLLYYPLDFLGL